MERLNCKGLLEKSWRDPRDDVQVRRKSYHDLKEIDTIRHASFVSSVLVRSTFVKGSLV